MPTQPPIIFLAFANEALQAEGRLRNLPLEQSQLQQALFEAKKQGLCELEVRSNVTLAEIVDVFQHYGERIAIFHYGGHANGYQLLLNSANKQDTSIAHSAGLIPFLCRQKGLKLAFLNGCSTQEQALHLNEGGISSIGTSNAINDEVALKVATRFYKGIAASRTLSEAWADAQNEIVATYGSQTRDLIWEGIQEETEDPNALWVNNFREEHLNWKLMTITPTLVLQGLIAAWNAGGNEVVAKMANKAVETIGSESAKALFQSLKARFAEQKDAKKELRNLEGISQDADASEEEVQEAIADFKPYLEEALTDEGFVAKLQELLPKEGAKIVKNNTINVQGDGNISL